MIYVFRHYIADNIVQKKEVTLIIARKQAAFCFLLLIFDSEEEFISQLYGFSYCLLVVIGG